MEDEDRDDCEDFDDLNEMRKFRTTDELVEFEENLENKEYFDRFVRFLKTKYNFNSIKNGETLFTLIVRQVIDYELFVPYSWKGLNRKNLQNLCFATKHVRFVSFMTRVVRTADKSKTSTDVESMFEKLLRFKKQNLARDKMRGNKPQKLPTPRIRVVPEVGTPDEGIITEEITEEISTHGEANKNTQEN